jgi:xylulokinase
MSLLGVDIGTTGCKAVIFSHEGRVLGKGYREYAPLQPRPGWMEINPETLWQAVVSAIREAVAANTSRDTVEALSVSTMGEVAFPIAKDGSFLYNGIIHFDSRGIEQAEWWDREVGWKEIFRITGMPKHQMYTATKMLWLRQNRPDVFRLTDKCLLVQAYFFFRLGLTPTVDLSLASRTMLFDVVKRQWSQPLLEHCGMYEGMLPQVVPAGTVVGTLNAKAAAELGLKKGIVAVAGGHDQPCAALGAGVVETNMAVDSTGTVECITVIFEEPLLSEHMMKSNMPCYCHVDPDFYVTPMFNLTGGSLLRWFRDNFSRLEVQQARSRNVDPYDLILTSMTQEPARAMVLPHFVGTGTPHLDPTAKGVIAGLRLDTTRGELIRAILEGVTFEMKLNLDIIEEAGVKVRQLRAIGGAAKSEAWLQLKADIFDRPVVAMEESEAACLGVALLAGKGVGVYGSLAGATEQTVKTRKAYLPTKATAELYCQRMELYKRLYPSLRELNPAL